MVSGPPGTIHSCFRGRRAGPGRERLVHDSGKPPDLLDLRFLSSKWAFGLWSGTVRSVQDGRQLAVRILQELTWTLMSVSQLKAWSLFCQALNRDFGQYSESWLLAQRFTVSMLSGLWFICLVEISKLTARNVTAKGTEYPFLPASASVLCVCDLFFVFFFTF